VGHGRTLTSELGKSRLKIRVSEWPTSSAPRAFNKLDFGVPRKSDGRAVIGAMSKPQHGWSRAQAIRRRIDEKSARQPEGDRAS
jgi:hypothetical protein